MSESLYIAETPARLIARQNGTSAASFSIPITKPQMAYVYLASEAEITDKMLQDLGGTDYLNVDQYQVVAYGDLSDLDSIIPDTIPTLSGTFKLNISQKAKTTLPTDTQKLYVADDIARKISRQRSVPTSSYNITINPLGGETTYPYFAVVIFNATSTFINKSYLQDKLHDWTVANANEDNEIDEAALLGYLDAGDVADFGDISQYYDFILTGTNRLTFKATLSN